MQSPMSPKVAVINSSPEELEAALRGWVSQHGRARVMGTSQSSTATSGGSVLVTVVLWYQE